MDRQGQVGPEKPEYPADVREVARSLVGATVYIALAEALSVDPGRLLGPDDAHKAVTEAEMTLVNVVRELRISPSEAIVQLTAGARPRGAARQSM